jgi:hypothetical protein
MNYEKILGRIEALEAEIARLQSVMLKELANSSNNVVISHNMLQKRVIELEAAVAQKPERLGSWKP